MQIAAYLELGEHALLSPGYGRHVPSDMGRGSKDKWAKLSNDVKGLAAFRTKAKYGKMSTEGRDPVNTETLHYSEAGAVDNGKTWSRQETPISQATVMKGNFAPLPEGKATGCAPFPLIANRNFKNSLPCAS